MVNNILIIGRTGSGKSALANVLVNEINEKGNFKNFKQVFKEGDSIGGVTKEVKGENFMKDSIEYRVVDTVGVGDPGLKVGEVIKRLLEAVTGLKEDGINQIIFVFDKRFAKEQTFVLNLFKKVILDERVVEYITIVRTNFHKFLNQNECKEDLNRYLNENPEESERESIKVIDFYNKKNKVIYIDNPPLDVYEKQARKVNLKRRSDSRKRLLGSLANCREIYKPKEALDEIIRRINDLGLGKNELVLEDVDRIYKEFYEEISKTHREIDEFIKERKNTTEILKKDTVSLPSLISILEHVKSLGVGLVLTGVTTVGSLKVISKYPKVKEIINELFIKLSPTADFVTTNYIKIIAGLIVISLIAKVGATGAQIHLEKKCYNKIMEMIDKDKKRKDKLLSQWKNQEMEDKLEDYNINDNLNLLPDFFSFETMKRLFSFELSTISSLYNAISELKNKINNACIKIVSNALRRKRDGGIEFYFDSVVDSTLEFSRVLSNNNTQNQSRDTSEKFSELIVEEVKRYIEHLEREETLLSEKSNEYKELGKDLKEAIEIFMKETEEKIIENTGHSEQQSQSKSHPDKKREVPHFPI